MKNGRPPIRKDIKIVCVALIETSSLDSPISEHRLCKAFLKAQTKDSDLRHCCAYITLKIPLHYIKNISSKEHEKK